MEEEKVEEQEIVKTKKVKEKAEVEVLEELGNNQGEVSPIPVVLYAKVIMPPPNVQLGETRRIPRLIFTTSQLRQFHQSVNNHSVFGAWSQVTTKIDAAVQKNMAVRVALVSTSFFAAIQMIARQGKIGLRQVLRSPSQPSLPRR